MGGETLAMWFRLPRRVLWIAGIPMLICAGYTAGYLLAPPAPAAVTRSLPPLPVEAPQPQPPALELMEDA